MYELLIRIETLCLEAQPLMLLGIGVAAVIVGLLLWLAGAYFSSVIISILGAVIGSFCGLLISQWFDLNPLLCIIIGAVLFCISAVLFKNIIIIVIAVIIFALAGGTAYSSFILGSPTQQQEVEVNPVSVQSFSHMDPDMRRAYIEGITEDEVGFSDKLKALLGDALKTMSPHKWKLLFSVLIGGFGCLLLVWLLKRLVFALCYSSIGTLLIFIGIECLLMTVGFQTCSELQGHRRVITITYFFMIGGGAIVQLVVTKYRKPKESDETEDKE
jgi:hypothetical protein